MENSDAIAIQLLDSVDQLLRLRHAVSTQLGEGWMEMTRARYAIGSSRVNESLLNLRPHAALLLAREGKDSRLELDLRSKDEIALQAHEEDSDDEESSIKRVDPLAYFGGFVTPHLRSSQGCFQKALGTILEIVNSQRTTSNILDANACS